MNLSYTLPHAEENILAGNKLHSLREDFKKRWRVGLTVHHCYSFRSKGGYRCFLKNECKGVQQVLLLLQCLSKNAAIYDVIIRIDRKTLTAEKEQQFIFNDGFKTRQDFINWFFPVDKKGKRKRTMWAGVCIHWTNLVY